ncbi:MAG: hypothetical protein M1268_03155, partial [Patescibacteria group bacterium]|nr:hypothetical protein [Patescibacteria group bacterium]
MNLQNQSNKNLIYDEVANNPVHYPRAILDNGEVYLDTFLPNSGAGWAYGMSVSNFTGTDKKDLDNMKNGTYGTQPVLSPDGKYLAFAGYSGTDGKNDQDGFRISLVKTNTLEKLDTQTKERLVLIEPETLKSYLSAKPDSITGNITYTSISPDNVKDGTFQFDINNKTVKKIEVEKIQNDTSIIGFLGE